MQCTCHHCSAAFEVTSEDVAFLEAVAPVFAGKKEQIPPPTLCPLCRRRVRNSWRNERTLYKRNCALCKKMMISIFAPDLPHVVYCPTCFWSDGWSPTEQEYDPSLSFTEQFGRLLQSTPIPGIVYVNAQNSEYCNRVYDSRNNYLSIIVLAESENALHSYYVQHCKDVCDVSLCQDTELSYELVDGEKCYACYFSTRLRNCSECWFSEDCTGCKNCFQCKNLRQRQYCIRNEQKTKQEYEAFMRSVQTGSAVAVDALLAEARAFFLGLPNRAALAIDCEHCTGANIFHCKDSSEIYNFYHSERMRHCTLGEYSHDCMDCFGFGHGEFCYENEGFTGANHNLFTLDSSGCSDLLYCCNVNANSTHCFGCVGLKKRSYCIFNTQYTKEQYETLVPQIIERMRATGEWGAWFSPSISPQGLNETVALEYCPTTEEEATRLGFRWRAKDLREYQPSSMHIPDNVADAKDDIVQAVLACGACGKNYRLVAQELDFYRHHVLPLPRHCPDCRHFARVQRRPPARLWARTCGRCGNDVLSSFPPDRPEIVYCEECYLKEVY